MAAALGALCGCVPRDYHVTYGLDPNRIDDDVRFRTTYYFRVFDYCWEANAPSMFAGTAEKPQTILYRQIIPETDTLFRYRMTGKAPALSKVRFEAGTLTKAQIEPFDKQVVFSEEGGGFLVRDAKEVKEAADRAAERAQTLALIKELGAYAAQWPVGDARNDNARAAIAKLYEKLLGLVDAPAVTAADFAAITAAVGETDKKLDTLIQEKAAQAVAGSDDPAKAKAEAEAAAAKQVADALKPLTDRLALVEVKLTGGPSLTAQCPLQATIRKGFQIMGPEGIRTFDQEERLILAMSTSAKPLIETIQQFSGRILNAQADPAHRLLPLAQESAAIEQARRIVAVARLGEADADTLFNQVDAALDKAGK